MDATSEVKAVDGHEAEGKEEDEQDDGEVLHLAVLELRLQLDHGDLPGEAHEPHESEDQGHSVQLVMDELVVLVDLEDESVVDVVSAENLHGEPG